MDSLSPPTLPLRQPSHDRYLIADQVDAGAVRRAVARYADAQHAAPERRGRAELVATELATNLLRHAEPGGWILVRPLPAAIELIAVDRGPGIPDMAVALSGRAYPVPTPEGLGCGLAAVRRAASVFDVYTRPGRGTTILAIVDLDGSSAPPRRRCWAGVEVALTEESGDGWAVAEVDHGLAVAVVDGLGHGPQASIAADAALSAFARDAADLDTFLARANAAMRTTRGGAVAVCRLDLTRRVLECVALGNISGRILAHGAERGLLSRSGTVGLLERPPRAQPSSYPWPAGATLVLWSDGLHSRLDLSTEPSLLAHDPAVVAATLHRNHARERDDATVVVITDPGAP